MHTETNQFQRHVSVPVLQLNCRFMTFQLDKCSAQTCPKPICKEMPVGMAQRQHVDTAAAPMHPEPKVEIWTSLRHDRMNFEYDQIRLGHAQQPFCVLCRGLSSFSTSLRSSSTATRATLGRSTGFKIGWKRAEYERRLLGNCFNERLRQRTSSTILGYGHCLHQFHPVQSLTVLSESIPLRTIPRMFQMILALKLRLDFPQYVSDSSVSSLSHLF